MNKLKAKFRFLGQVLFTLYILILCYFLFFAEGFGRGMAVETHGYNTVPFLEIKRYINNFYTLGMISVLNKGLGKLSMTAILDYLKSLGKTKIHLQLLLENTPAYKIYKELGFIITSEISYYKKTIE